MKVIVRHYSDPGCPWSWAGEKQLRRLMWEFGDELEFVWVMGGLARTYGSDYRDSHGRIGEGADCFADLIAHWLEVAAETGMPLDPRFWAERPLASTYPACQAVKAASEQGPAAGYRYLRLAREGVMFGGRRLDRTEPLIELAGEAGLDVGRFEIDLASTAITEAFAADLAEVRDVPDAARDAGETSETEGKERITFPSYVFEGDGGREAAYGSRDPRELRAAALAAGAEPQRTNPPEPLELVSHFGRIATAELMEISERPRGAVEAELWGAAADLRVRPVEALSGMLWEAA